MGYMAAVPLRFGGGIIQAGEPVPVERGRNYTSMLRLGQIVVVPDRAHDAPDVEKLGERQWTHGDTEEVFDTKREATAEAESSAKPAQSGK